MAAQSIKLRFAPNLSKIIKLNNVITNLTDVNSMGLVISEFIMGFASDIVPREMPMSVAHPSVQDDIAINPANFEFIRLVAVYETANHVSRADFVLSTGEFANFV